MRSYLHGRPLFACRYGVTALSYRNGFAPPVYPHDELSLFLSLLVVHAFSWASTRVISLYCLVLRVQSYSSSFHWWFRRHGLCQCCSSGSCVVVPVWPTIVFLQVQGYCSPLRKWLHLDGVHSASHFPLHNSSPLSLPVIHRSCLCLLPLLLSRVVRSLLLVVVSMLAFVVTRFPLSVMDFG